MKHIVTFSNALVITTLDDSAEVISIAALPLSLALYLPCQLYALLSSLTWQIPRLLAGVQAYVQDWRNDLALMAAAVNEARQAWVGFAWALGTG